MMNQIESRDRQSWSGEPSYFCWRIKICTSDKRFDRNEHNHIYVWLPGWRCQ